MQRRRSILSFLAFAAVLCASLLVPPAFPQEAAPQESPEDPSGLFVETVDVNVVNVEVYVTDKKGNRITGLGRDDFELTVDRRPVKITNFYAVENAKAVTLDASTAEQEQPQDRQTGTRLQALETPADQRLYLIAYVDNFNVHPLHRNRALGYVRRFISQHLGPQDQAMIISYDRALHVRQPFTSDKALIQNALFEVEDLSGFAIQIEKERRELLTDIFEADELYEVHGRTTQLAESIWNDLKFSIRSLKEIIDSLAGLPGRKAVLYVSDGFAIRAGEDLFMALDEKFEDSSVLAQAYRYDGARQLEQLTAQANANRITFYTVEAAGLRTYSFNNAENATSSGRSRIDEAHFANIRTPLYFMAEETGGQAIVDTNNFTGFFDRIGEDLRTYYSLGFMPAASGNRYQKLEVRVKGRKDLRLRYREGFRDKSAGVRMTEKTLAALYYGIESNPLSIDLELGRAQPQEDGLFLVPLTIKIPVEQITFLEQQDMQRGRLRLFLAVKHDDGAMSPVDELPVPIDLSTATLEKAQGQSYRYNHALLMRAGRQAVAVGVRDEIGAASAVIMRGMTIGS